MRRFPRGVFLAAAAMVLASCVSVEENALTVKSLPSAAKVMVLVFPSPGPHLLATSTTIGSAAETIPGLGLLAQSADDQTVDAFAQSVPSAAWDVSPDSAAAQALVVALAQTGSPGSFALPREDELPHYFLRRFNESSGLIDWEKRYFNPEADKTPRRDYQSLSGLKGELVFEGNLLYGITDDGTGSYAPRLVWESRLWSVDDMKILWKHQDFLDGAALGHPPAYYQVHAQELAQIYVQMAPSLVQTVATSFHAALVASRIIAAVPTVAASTQTYAAPLVSTSAAPSASVTGSTVAASTAAASAPATSSSTISAPAAAPASTGTALPSGLPGLSHP